LVAFVGTLLYAQRAAGDKESRLAKVSPAAPEPTVAPGHHTEMATFAGGCFWGIQAKFDHIKGVIHTTVGYTGGNVASPTYEQVCTHKTGHAEAVQVEFDPEVVSYRQLVDDFWKLHDPRQRNRQGPDVGSNYRSAIFYHSPEQKAVAEASKNDANTTGGFAGTIVTEIVPAKEFYPAEEYHQHYFRKQGVEDQCMR
jgi:methionine-S-sulfoxide reductase